VSPEVALPAGYLLNEYKIDALLGMGGFGSTYLATDTNLNLKVAIKEYLPTGLVERGADHSVRPKAVELEETFNWGRARFLEESRTIASFRHPNIVRVMRFFQTNATAYMVMEFVAGQALQHWMKSRPALDERSVLSIVLPLLEGLEIVHQGGYLHRDIKPANIFVRADGSPVLIDFGSARALTGKSELTSIVSPGFAPLEQYDSRGAQGPWSDLYAVGGVLYWMVTGQQPVEAPARAFSDPMVPAVKAANGSVYSPSLLKAIDWALKPSKDERPKSVGELREALQGPASAPVSALATRLPVKKESPAAQAPADAEAVSSLTSALASHIGPIADKLVQSHLRKGDSLVQIAEKMAAEISDAKERAAFVQKFTGASRPHPTTTPGAFSPTGTMRLPARFSVEELAKAETDLAQYIGAVARVVVKRAAAKARDMQELYALLALEIDDAEAKRVFLRKALSRSGRPS
jgi:serine/threonine protein kinase